MLAAPARGCKPMSNAVRALVHNTAGDHAVSNAMTSAAYFSSQPLMVFLYCNRANYASHHVQEEIVQHSIVHY